MEYNIAKPPKEFFETTGDGSQSILNENSTTFILKEIEISKTKGMLLHMQDADFPKKGFPFPEAMFSVNQAKRLFISTL